MSEPTTITSELVTEMIKAGVIYGHNKSKTHPRMKEFIAGNRNEIELIDPEATLLGLDKAIVFLREKLSKGGLVLVVGTGLAAKQAVTDLAAEYHFPFCVTRWLGGTLTNYKMIATRLRYFDDQKGKTERGELGKYTKKEQLEFAKEIRQMAKVFDGLKLLMKVPDALVVVDIKLHETAVLEARKLGIPVVAILDTDDDPKTVEYPIFGSDHTKSSIDWIVGKIRDGLRGAVVQTKPAVTPPAETAKKVY